VKSSNIQPVSPQLLHSGIRMHSVEIILLDSILAGHNKHSYN